MRLPIITMLVIVIAVTCAALNPVRAGEVPRLAPETIVSPGRQATYLDLARRFVPDIKRDGTSYSGSHHIRVRHVGGQEAEVAEGDAFGIHDVSTFRYAANGKPRLLVLFDFGEATQSAQGFAVLALYDLTKEPVLLDAADVGYDRWTSFFGDRLVPLGDGAQAVITLSTHFNAGQSYAGYTLLLLRNDQITQIDHMTLLNDVNGSIHHDLAIAYSAGPTTGDRPAPILGTVTETIRLVEELCEGFDTCAMAKKTVRQAYLWDARDNKYVPDSDAFEKVKAENESRF